MNKEKFDFKKYLKNLITENKRMLSEVYKANDAIEVDETHKTFGDMVRLIKSPTVSSAITSTAPSSVSGWNPATADYYAVNPSAQSLQQTMLYYHGQGGTGSGDSGEQIAASLGTIISSEFPRLSNVSSIQNLNDEYPGLGITTGFFPGADLLFWKNADWSSVNLTGGTIDLTNITELASVKRAGTPGSQATKKTAFGAPNFSDDALKKMAAILLLKWLQTRKGTQTQSIITSFPGIGGITKGSKMNEIYSAAQNEGVTQITFNVSDITVSAVPYFNKNMLTNNMSEADIKKYPAIEAIMVNSGGNVTVDIQASTVTKNPNNLNGINNPGAKGKGYSLIGFLISGDQHKLLQLGGQNFDKASQTDVNVTDLPPQLEFEQFVIGSFSRDFDRLISLVNTSEGYTFFNMMKEMMETDLSQASQEFKAALVMLNAIEQLVKKSGSQFMPSRGGPGARPSGSEFKLTQTSGTKYSLDQSQRKEIAFAPKGHSTLGKKGAEVFTKDTKAILSDAQIPVLGERIANYILDKSNGLKSKLDKARAAEVDAKSSIQEEAAAIADTRRPGYVGSPLQADATTNLAEAQEKLGTIDDFIDSMHMFISYLSLIAVECLRHPGSSNLVKKADTLISELEPIVIKYQNIAQGEISGTSVGENPDLIRLKTTKDGSGNVISFPGVKESLTLTERIDYQIRLLEREVLDFDLLKNTNDLFKGLEALITVLDSFILASGLVSDLPQRKQVAENKIRLAIRKAIMNELKKRY